MLTQEEGRVGLDGLALDAHAEDESASGRVEVFYLVGVGTRAGQFGVLRVHAGVGDVHGLLAHAAYGDGLSYFHIFCCS